MHKATLDEDLKVKGLACTTDQGNQDLPGQSHKARGTQGSLGRRSGHGETEAGTAIGRDRR